MQALLVGLGGFGAVWSDLLKTDDTPSSVVVVDSDPALGAAVQARGDRFYTSLEQAFDQEKPDWVLNATPPGAHTAINHAALDHRLPVLCEKPLALDYAEAAEVVARAERDGIRLMVAENYRRFPIVRKMKSLIAAGALGDLVTLHVNFFRDFESRKPYLLAMAEPMLMDVTVHHLDMMRYLTGSEGRRLFAHSYSPKGSTYPGNAAVDLILEMENGAHISYTARLSAPKPETDWKGYWRIEGTRGVLIATDEILLVQDGHTEVFGDLEGVEIRGSLDDFLAWLEGGPEPETSGRNNLKTQCLLHHALESAHSGRMVEVTCAPLENEV